MAKKESWIVIADWPEVSDNLVVIDYDFEAGSKAEAIKAAFENNDSIRKEDCGNIIAIPYRGGK